jgi:hypothetical protein
VARIPARSDRTSEKGSTMNSSRTRRLAAVIACAAVLGLAAFAAPASASASRPGASRATLAGRTLDNNFGCGSVPAFYGSVDGHFNGQGINIRSGPRTSCTSYGLGYEGNALKVWCSVTEPDGVTWYYLNDRTTGVRGWSEVRYVVVTGGGVMGCFPSS